MTPEEIREWRARLEKQRRLEERRKTIAADLRLEPREPDLMAEAAEVIDYLNERLKQADKDLREESHYAQRAAGDAYHEGRAEGLREGRRSDW